MTKVLLWLLWLLWTLFGCPVPVVGEISSPYGWREDPFSGERRFHAGLDLAAPEGAPVWLPFDSTVMRVVNGGSFGRHVVVESHHGTILLAHLSDWTVEKGQRLPAWTTLGHVGQTGRATGPHLHIELHQGTRRRNPARVFLCRVRPTAAMRASGSAFP